ncbi:hypothetical protein [Streptomyces sp. E5N91]|uniref:hypothetical protein n=1 Tax=Streptomyces sp. E5N91 TaxID=1851996 RepID=UPI001291EDC1|nr:hypothetical protein [Streptomyces sp. E5N91]
MDHSSVGPLLGPGRESRSSRLRVVGRRHQQLCEEARRQALVMLLGIRVQQLALDELATGP